MMGRFEHGTFEIINVYMTFQHIKKNMMKLFLRYNLSNILLLVILHLLLQVDLYHFI